MTTAISKRIASVSENMRGCLKDVCSGSLFSFFLGIPPVPASRPRVTKFGTVYYGAPYKRFYEAAQAELRKVTAPYTEGPLVVLAEFIVEKPRTGKLDYPRGDSDNYAKGPLDAMTKAVEKFWKDDNQVVGLLVFKRYAEPGEPVGIKLEYAPL